VTVAAIESLKSRVPEWSLARVEAVEPQEVHRFALLMAALSGVAAVLLVITIELHRRVLPPTGDGTWAGLATMIAVAKAGSLLVGGSLVRKGSLVFGSRSKDGPAEFQSGRLSRGLGFALGVVVGCFDAYLLTTLSTVPQILTGGLIVSIDLSFFALGRELAAIMGVLVGTALSFWVIAVRLVLAIVATLAYLALGVTLLLKLVVEVIQLPIAWLSTRRHVAPQVA
jgi:hypothetical protein